MSIATVHVLHGIQNSSTFISQISSATPTPAMEYLIGTAAGMPWSQFVGNLGVRPGLQIQSPQVATILALTGAIPSIVDLSAANTDLFFKKVTDLGSRLANATAGHIRMRMAQAFLNVQSVSVGHRQEAVVNAYLGTTWDGTNVPLVPAGSTALSGTETAAEHFVQGPVFLNSTELDGIESMTIDFGRELIQAGSGGELYDTFAAHRVTNPVITIRCYELPSWVTFGLNGTALTAGSFYLRKVATTGRVANATAQHIKFAATAGLISIDDTQSGNNDEAMTTIRVSLIGESESAAPLTVNTAIAITT